MKAPLVLAITGASGAIYATRLLEVLINTGNDVHLSISPSAQLVLRQELGIHIDLDNFHESSLLLDNDKSASDSKLALTRALAGVASDDSSVLPGGSIEPGDVFYHHHEDMMAPIASGSFLTSGMVICPCSGGALSSVVHGASNNLIERAADVHLKERRKLILVPRETPLSGIHLANMKTLSDQGAVILPAMPAFYHNPLSIHDLIDFVVARICDQLGIEKPLTRRWGEAET